MLGLELRAFVGAGDLAGRRVGRARDEVQQGRFAGTIGSGNFNDRAGAQRERGVLDRPGAAEAVAFANGGKFAERRVILSGVGGDQRMMPRTGVREASA
ncbi:MAG: hypothetical protein JHD16_15710 [Solirubrobacteraceae bacterium]|nr:hypothetical protein [Solirubrobacteraceae bacterium]